MKTLLKYSIVALFVLTSCSAMYKDLIYEGNYKEKTITINFEDARSGYIIVDNRDSIPFSYKIEKNKIENEMAKKIKTYVYRFTIDAKYNIDFPLGLYEIGQKRGKVLQVNDSLTFIRQ